MTCRRCGEPHGRTSRARYCFPCVKERDKEINRAYRASPKGRARYRARHLEPKWKLYYAAYAAKHPDKMREYKRRYEYKRRKSGRVINCATLWCTGTFIRTPDNGSKKFGDDCDCRLLSNRYSNTLAGKRYRARAA